MEFDLPLSSEWCSNEKEDFTNMKAIGWFESNVNLNNKKNTHLPLSFYKKKKKDVYLCLRKDHSERKWASGPCTTQRSLFSYTKGTKYTTTAFKKKVLLFS